MGNDRKGLDIKMDEQTSEKLINFPNQQNTNIAFSLGGVKITKNGFYYKDQRIDDVAGVYKAMCLVLKDYICQKVWITIPTYFLLKNQKLLKR